MSIAFTPSAPPVSVFPEHLQELAAKLAKQPWPEADREMRVMRAQSQAKYLADLWVTINAAREQGEAFLETPLGGEVSVGGLVGRARRQSEELFWDEMLVLLNDATARRQS